MLGQEDIEKIVAWVRQPNEKAAACGTKKNPRRPLRPIWAHFH